MSLDQSKMTVKAPAITNDVADRINAVGTDALVDKYGRLKAQAADVTAELDSIKQTLIEQHGECKLEGELFRMSLAHSLRSTTDWKAVALAMAKKAGVGDKAFDNCIAANTGVADCWIARCNARVTK